MSEKQKTNKVSLIKVYQEGKNKGLSNQLIGQSEAITQCYSDNFADFSQPVASLLYFAGRHRHLPLALYDSRLFLSSRTIALPCRACLCSTLSDGTHGRFGNGSFVPYLRSWALCVHNSGYLGVKAEGYLGCPGFQTHLNSKRRKWPWEN